MTESTDHADYIEHPAHQQNRRALVRFSPEVNTGQIWQFIGFLLACGAAWGTYTADQARRDQGVEQIKIDAKTRDVQWKESLGEMRSDVKDIQRTLIDVNQSLAVLKARPPLQQQQR